MDMQMNVWIRIRNYVGQKYILVSENAMQKKTKTTMGLPKRKQKHSENFENWNIKYAPCFIFVCLSVSFSFVCLGSTRLWPRVK